MDKKAPECGPEPVLLAFGQTVRQLRKARGFSQETFAQYWGLDRSYLGGVERGERNITLANIERIIAALHMKPSEFFLALDAQFRDINVQLKTVQLNGFAAHYLQGIPRKSS